MSVTKRLFPLDGVLLERNLAPLLTKTFIALLLCGVAASSGLKAQAASGSMLYRLNPESNFERGCFPPCFCPVMIGEPVKGTFLLTPTGFDGLFNTYVVMDVNWSGPINGAATVVTGSGTYKVGGEFALQQQLSLNLQIGGGNVEHFDSGLVADSAPFPDINVTISTNRQYCFDTVFNVSASPTPVPQLHVCIASANTVLLSWAVSAAPFILEESSEFSATNWTPVTNTPTVIGQQNQIVLPRLSGNKYYRLEPSGN